MDAASVEKTVSKPAQVPPGPPRLLLLTRQIAPFLATALLVGVALLISGCATAQSVDLARGAGSRIRKVALMPVDPPVNVLVMNIGGGASMFGAIGGLIQGADNSEKSKAYKELMIERGVQLDRPLTAALRDQLKRSGYEVTLITDQKPKVSADGRTKNFKEIRTDADAILVVSVGAVGYISGQFSTYYQPWVAATAVLIDARTKEVLYTKTFSAGFKMKVKNAVHIETAERYKFPSYDELSGHFDESINGLVDGEMLIAGQVAEDLKLN